MELDLSLFPVERRKAAQGAFDRGNGHLFIELADEDNDHLRIVDDNSAALLGRGIYEQALLEAYAEGASGNWRWAVEDKQWLFDLADRDKLRTAGDRLPFDNHRFTVYRGVSGVEPHRQVRSCSWTLYLHWAVHFAISKNLPDPAVYRAVVGRDEILAYWDRRGEGEVIVYPQVFERVEIEGAAA